MERKWDTQLYDGKHSFVWKYGTALLDLLEPKPGERILDLGCGTGHLTAQAAATGAQVVGLDQSSTMIAQARQKYPEIRFEVGDARAFSFAEPFDAILSNATLHWVREPEAVIDCVRRALRPGGRFVAEFGGKGNVQIIRETLAAAARRLVLEEYVHPWYFPSLAEYAQLLERGGLEVTFAHLFDRPTPLEGEHGLRDWLRMFAGEYLERVPASRQEELFRTFEELAKSRLYAEGHWRADYRRLRVAAGLR